MKKLVFFFFLFFALFTYSQKDTLSVNDSYADDQIYASITYNQLNQQPTLITKSGFSYGFSAGFLKDFILNKQGTFSVAAGFGYGYNFFNHQLKVEEINGKTIFSSDNTISENTFKAHNLEFPFEIRWRTSTAKKYNFWRVYAGVKLIYNLSNRFHFLDANNSSFKYKNISSYNKLQYGLTLSAGYDEFNIHVFYGLSPIYKSSVLNTESINTKILKFGLIFYLL